MVWKLSGLSEVEGPVVPEELIFPMPDWTEHCPIDEEEDPVHRQAWRGGWGYRMEHGPGKPDKETVLNVMGKPSLLVVWMEGYSAADRVASLD